MFCAWNWFLMCGFFNWLAADICKAYGAFPHQAFQIFPEVSVRFPRRKRNLQVSFHSSLTDGSFGLFKKHLIVAFLFNSTQNAKCCLIIQYPLQSAGSQRSNEMTPPGGCIGWCIACCLLSEKAQTRCIYCFCCYKLNQPTKKITLTALLCGLFVSPK